MEPWKARRSRRRAKRAASLWPRHFAVWFTQVYYRAYTGNAAEALAFLADTSGRPVGIPEWNFDLVRSQVDAIANNDLAKIRSTEKQLEPAAHNSAGFAENAILFTAFTGLADDAFKIANGLYNNRGFDVAEAWFSPERPFTWAKSAILTFFSNSRCRAMQGHALSKAHPGDWA